MRLLELHLKAFGHFTDRRLDLSGGTQGLHLVYGPNEAGKSSALRALKCLLYGFPARSGDDFLHPYDQLRVGARLRWSDGGEQELLRRKGRRATLLAADGETPLDEALLAGALQGIDEAVFSSLFGLDHDGLVRGGEELLAQRGDVGQALFAAGLGTRNLRQVLAGLDAEAEALFLPRGSRPRINQALAAQREAKREQAELSLSGREWDGKRRELEAMRAESDALERDLAASQAERSRLQRIRRLQPALGERRDLLLRLEELGPVRLLAGDFGDRRRANREALRAAAAAGARAAAELADVQKEAATLTVAGAVLDQAETIERLYRGVELYTKNGEDRSRLLGERGEARAAAAELLDEVRPGLTVEEAEALRPALDRWLRIQELSSQFQTLRDAARLAAEGAAAAASALAAARAAAAALPPAGDTGPLRRRLDAARKAGDLDRTLAEAAAALARGDEELRLDLARLPLWQGTAEALEALPVPAEETLRRFAGELDALALRRGAAAGPERAARGELAEVERRLEELRASGAVPGEDDLIAARRRRDNAWQEVRRAWRQGDEAPAAAAAYERSVEAADALADRLRREADRVQEQAQLLARRGELGRALGEMARDEVKAAADEEALAASWRALWRPCGIEPLPPREMHPAWTHRRELLAGRAAVLRAERHRLADLRARRAEHRAAVARELAALAVSDAAALAAPPRPGDSAAFAVSDAEALEPLLAAAEERLRDLDRRTAEAGRLAAAESDAADRHGAAVGAEAAARAALAGWQEEWAAAVRDLGLDREARPAEALKVVELLRAAFAKLGDVAKLDRRVAGIERDLESFRAAVGALAAEIAPELAGRPAEQAAAQLQALSAAAARAADRRAAIDRRTAKLAAELRAAEATRSSAEGELAALAAEAGAATAAGTAGLEAAERDSARLRELRRDRERVERQLQQEGDGLALAALESEAAAIDADALPGRLDQLDRDIEAQEARSRQLREELGRGRQELRQMAGGDAAAQAAERAQEILAGLRDDVRRYARVRLAAAVLRRQIERYRVENQDPLLRRAAEQLAALTLGSYSGLGTDFDERDEPVLVGLRPDGRRVRVEGMSDGARDQLYLALRLATLERYLARAEPLPFVLDDILVNFDDARSAATLAVLAELATKTQVILFTHHARLRELAAGLGGGAEVFVRELG